MVPKASKDLDYMNGNKQNTWSSSSLDNTGDEVLPRNYQEVTTMNDVLRPFIDTPEKLNMKDAD